MTKVIFIDDIFRDEIAEARKCIYKTLRALFKRAFGVEIMAPRLEIGMPNIFADLRKKYTNIKWTEVYFELPKEIEHAYVKLLDKDAIYLSYEAPLWLFKIWKKHKIKYLDLRLSYLRFLPDIPVMFSTNISSMIPVIKKFEIQQDDIFYEADLLKASYDFRHYKDYRNLKRYENGLVILGQTDSDTSLMVKGYKDVIKFSDYEEKIKTIFPLYQQVFYKKHPFASQKHAEEEMLYFNSLLKQPIKICTSNFYNMATQDFKIDFMALSSGAIKEAHYFGQKNYMLMDYPFEYVQDNDSITYLNIESFYFFSPKFWQELLGAELPISRICMNYREPHRNIMRDHHNASWGFNEFYYENRASNNERLMAWGSFFIQLWNQKKNSDCAGTGVIKDAIQYAKNKHKYWKYKIFSKITFGKKRNKYKLKQENLKMRLKAAKHLLRGE